MDKLEKLFENAGLITTADAPKTGIKKYQFYQYVEENNLERVGHGVYAKKDEWIDELYILHKRCPAAVFSHDEALYYYDLIDREPDKHTLTTYTGYNTRRLVESDCKVYTVKKDLLNLGKKMVTDNYGNDIPIYDLDRTICDMVRSRRNFEIQDFNAALKTYARRKDKDLNCLMFYAKLFHVDKIIRTYMEVLL